ncbi:PAS domain S-box protein, partial [bacterium]|nr:PAS domain S-box protein [bacterium]
SAIDRRRAEQELRRSQEFIQRVADASPNILYIYDLQEQRNIYVNREITTLLGYTPGHVQAVGSNLLATLFHPDDLANIANHHRRFDTMQEGEVVEIEYRVRDSEGNWHWFVSRDTLFARTKDGKAKQIVGAASDITHRKQTEEWFRLSERAIASSSNGIVISDIRQRDRPLVFVNPAFERITGYTPIEVLGRNCRFLQGEDRNQPEVDQLRQAVKEGKSCKVVLRNYRKDGSLFWNEIAISPIHDAEGNLTHYLGIQNDITAF